MVRLSDGKIAGFSTVALINSFLFLKFYNVDSQPLFYKNVVLCHLGIKMP